MIKKTGMVLLIIIICSFYGFAETTKESLKKIGFQTPAKDTIYTDIIITDLNGKQISLSQYKGKVIMLNFWATWCPPCRAEMPSMEDLSEKMQGKNFEIIAVNIQESADTVKKFLEQNKYSFPVFLDPKGDAAAAYNIRAIPTTYIIDKDGKIAGILTGSREWNTKEVIAIFSKISE